MAHAGVISLSGWSRPLSVRGRGLVAWLFLLIAILGSGYQLARAASHVAPAVTADHAATTGSADAYDLGPQHARARVSSDRRTLADVGQKPLGSAPTSLAASTVVAAEVGGAELVQRAMSRAELQATQATGLIRGGREGTHYVSDNVNSNALRARQRLALPQTPEVRVTLEVPRGAFSPPKLVDPLYDMPGGGMERMGTGQIACRVVAVLDYC